MIGELAKSGWRPARTLMFPRLGRRGARAVLGSTEWAELHAEELQRHAVAYINSDGTGRGFLRVSGASSLELFSMQTARDLTDPQTHVPVLDRFLASRKVAGGESEFRIEPLGSGSDYTVFQHHLGFSA